MIHRDEQLQTLYTNPLEKMAYTMSRKNGEIAGRLVAQLLFANEEITSKDKEITSKNMELERDDLTKLYNKKALETYGDEWVANKKPFIIIYYDLTNFKRINDEFGHAEGDLLIMNAADIISCHKRKDDVIARVGGDEFVGMFQTTPRNEDSEDMTPLERAQSIIDRTNVLFDEHINTLGMSEQGFSISMGVVEFDPEKHATFQDVCNQADRKMLEHKKLQHLILGAYRP
jgi:diguanylate cyclase (GGDEF)-like protein